MQCKNHIKQPLFIICISVNMYSLFIKLIAYPNWWFISFLPQGFCLIFCLFPLFSLPSFSPLACIEFYYEWHTKLAGCLARICISKHPRIIYTICNDRKMVSRFKVLNTAVHTYVHKYVFIFICSLQNPGFTGIFFFNCIALNGCYKKTT